MEKVRSACPLNCPDGCAFWVQHTEQGLNVHGDKENPITRGFICEKGRALAKRASSPDRLRFPLLREGGTLKRVSWEAAYDRLAREIRQTLAEVGPWGSFIIMITVTTGCCTPLTAGSFSHSAE